MRMQLAYRTLSVFTAVMTVAVIATGNVMAEDNVNSEIYYQGFSNGVAVVTPLVEGKKEMSAHTSFSFKLLVDVVGQGIGLDGISGASKPKARKNKSRGVRHYEIDDNDDGNSGEGGSGSSVNDIRKEIALGMVHMLSSSSELGVSYDYSNEKDYVSHTPSINFVQNLFQKNTTLAIGYSPMFDTVNGEFMSGPENKRTDTIYTSYTQVLSPKTLAKLGYSMSRVNGFISSGTKQVTVNNVDVNEALPDSREKQAMVFNLNQYLPSRSSVQFTYRYYWDDWEIKSHTVNTEYFKYIGRLGLMRLRYRYYTQPGTFFYKEKYTGQEEFLTDSDQFKDMQSHMFGVRFDFDLDVQPTSGIDSSKLEVKLDRYTQSIGVSGNIMMVGLNLTF